VAQRTTLTDDALRIADSIRSYLLLKGCEPGSSLIFMRVNKAWNTFSVENVSKHFTKDRFGLVDDHYHIEVLDHLREDLEDVPGLSQATSLNLYTFDDEVGLATLYYPILDNDEVEIDFATLNPGVADPRSPIARGSVQGRN
jgi:hypothetical protein